MDDPRTGSWPTAAQLASESQLVDLAWDTASETLYWLEQRDGSGVVVRWSPERGRAALPLEHGVRSLIGYGGGEFGVGQGRVVYTSGDRLWLWVPDDAVSPVAARTERSLAAPVISPDGVDLVWVSEGHVGMRLEGCPLDRSPEDTVLQAAADFYMQPAWHPDGSRLAWLEWDHPSMPWDGTRLMLAEVVRHDSGLTIDRVEHIAGGDDVSIFQPAFSPDGLSLSYCSDEEGFSQIYRSDLDGTGTTRLTPDQAEYSRPAWLQGLRTYDWGPSNQLIAIRNEMGMNRLEVVVSTEAQWDYSRLDHFTSLKQPALSPSGNLAVIACAPRSPPAVVVLAPDGLEVLNVSERVGPTMMIQRSGLKAPAAQPVRWESNSGVIVHGLFYPPWTGAGPRSAVIVEVHGGPSGQRVASWSWLQYFLARGYGVLQVNYRGSTGYGRDYRDRLRGQWGLMDIEDVISGVDFLVRNDLGDPDHLYVMGESAGGLTVLGALVARPGLFRAGVCVFGISNILSWRGSGTHWFESHYTEGLVGPLPLTEELHQARSPLHRVHLIRDPVLVFHGDEDRVVPMQQSEDLVRELRTTGVEHEYHVYRGEGHGWRRSGTIRDYLETIGAFFRRSG